MMNSFKGKRVLVTGATGLIGSQLTHSLAKVEGIKIIAVSRNKQKLEKSFLNYFSNANFSIIAHDISEPLESFEYPFDYIFHAASPQENKIIHNRPIEVINANISGTLNCLDLLERQKNHHGVEGRLILFSSVTVYGNQSQEDIVVRESDTYTAQPLESKGAPYSESKRMSEVIARAYFNQFGSNITIARLSTVYGDTLIKSDTAFFEFLNNVIIRQNTHIQNCTLPRRDNIYLEDAISGLICIALHGKTGEVYNISSNGELGNFKAIDEIAEVIKDEANQFFGNSIDPLIVDYENSIKGYRMPGIKMDNSKLKELGWEIKTSFNEGIRKTLASCLS